jgi:diguanylate cyclase (GGDEF)-like protein/PAS domain S-box-containing protein
MNEQAKTKTELIEELSFVKQRVQELEKSEAELIRAKEALQESEEKYHTLVEKANEAIVIVQDGVFVFANRRMRDLLGVPAGDLEGKPFIDFVWPGDRELVMTNYRKRVAGETVRDAYDFRIIDAGGGPTWVFLSAAVINWKGKPATLNLITDITERKKTEEALRASEARYRTLVENASDIVFRLDDTGHVTFVNPAALRVTGYGEKELIGKHYAALIRPDMHEEALKFFGRQFVKKIENTYSEYPVIVKDGREIWLGQNTQLIFQDGKMVAFQAMARDITERKEMEALLKDSEKRYRELSIIDDLTQLYNSRHFYFQLKIELDRANRYEQPLTLLLLDLDNFKAFNDAYGHVEGDQVLKRLGQAVKRCLRETDFAYRYGGEEFTIILPMTTSADGAVTAERIRTEFRKEIFSPAPGRDVHATVSIGLAQYKPQEEMKAFVHRVDQLMYRGKKNGKDRVCCEP